MLDVNPAAGVRLFNVDSKVEHYLDDAQFQKLLMVLRTDSNRAICRIAMFLLSTGCRLNEALQSTWGQIDEGSRTWKIPALNSKSKRIRSVPLNDSALAILAEVRTAAGEPEGNAEGAPAAYVFLNRLTGLPYTTIMKVWSRLRKTAGVPHLRIHDLRHNSGSRIIPGAASRNAAPSSVVIG
jgi:integrase